MHRGDSSPASARDGNCGRTPPRRRSLLPIRCNPSGALPELPTRCRRGLRIFRDFAGAVEVARAYYLGARAAEANVPSAASSGDGRQLPHLSQRERQRYHRRAHDQGSPGGKGHSLPEQGDERPDQHIPHGAGISCPSVE